MTIRVEYLVAKMFPYQRVIGFLKDWTLPVAIVVGIGSYLAFHYAGFSPEVHYAAELGIAVLQPILIFLMLFLAFCHVSVRDMKIKRWHWWLLLIQTVASSVFAIAALHLTGDWKIIVEAAFCCIICPTATASAIITSKLDGSIADCSTYVIISNLLASILIPLFVPLLNPVEGLTFMSMFLQLTAKFFPLLIGPLLLAWLIRYTMPRFNSWLLKQKEWAFYLWLIALPIAIIIATKALFHSNITLWTFIGVAVVSLGCCLVQFHIGHKIGVHYGDRVTTGQALGQKNTGFIIWVAYTFMAPVNAVAGGLYCIWHNNMNAWQLYKHKKAKAAHLK
ncbi:MAG: transporter [Paludibacteraceae bacterium]|nr:transporter [Paludibacteraceae bacterium]